MTTGVKLIEAERQRQIEAEGYSRSHDREHFKEELARAAAVYAMPADYRLKGVWDKSLSDLIWPSYWNFKPSPNDRIRELVKAGALIAAEIDRLMQASGGEQA